MELSEWEKKDTKSDTLEASYGIQLIIAYLSPETTQHHYKSGGPQACDIQRNSSVLVENWSREHSTISEQGFPPS